MSLPVAEKHHFFERPVPALRRRDIRNAVSVEVANAGVGGGLGYRFEGTASKDRIPVAANAARIQTADRTQIASPFSSPSIQVVTEVKLRVATGSFLLHEITVSEDLTSRWKLARAQRLFSAGLMQ
jgi:hypothetical protein